MALSGWTESTQDIPPITWDGKTSTLHIRLKGEDGKELEIDWKPETTYVARFREIDKDEWSIGVETPRTGITITDLKPDTEYDIELRSKNAAGESEPVRVTYRTGPDGGMHIS